MTSVDSVILMEAQDTGCTMYTVHLYIGTKYRCTIYRCTDVIHNDQQKINF